MREGESIPKKKAMGVHKLIQKGCQNVPRVTQEHGQVWSPFHLIANLQEGAKHALATSR